MTSTRMITVMVIMIQLLDESSLVFGLSVTGVALVVPCPGLSVVGLSVGGGLGGLGKANVLHGCWPFVSQ